MNRKRLQFYGIGLITAVALFTFVSTLQGALWGSAPLADAGFSLPQQTTVRDISSAITLPAELAIPALSLKARVQHVGLTASGAMGIPSNFTDVAWYKNGTIPGQRGSAVMAGHLDNGLGLNGVFKHLDELKPGDDIFVKDAAGNTVHFVVKTLKKYPYDQVPVEEIFNESEKSLLRLITCGGRWVRKAKTYDERVIVTAERVSATAFSTSETLNAKSP